MKTHLSLPLQNNKKYGKILHITDTHLFADDNGSLLGINTNASFKSVINEIKQQNETFDLIVATGDFVQDQSQEAYHRFANEIKQFSVPCVWLQGNHDVSAYMELVFNQHKLLDDKVILFGDKWLIVLLNSQVEGKADGLLAPAQLSFLSTTLDRYPDRYAMVFLHHHPIMSGCKWLDTHCLKNSDAFGHIIQKHQNVKSIGWGHIHQTLEKEWHNCKVFSTPSTCVQFKPLCDDFSLCNDAPGWRVINLYEDGELHTRAHCLKQNLFLPDTSQNGY